MSALLQMVPRKLGLTRKMIYFAYFSRKKVLYWSLPPPSRAKTTSPLKLRNFPLEPLLVYLSKSRCQWKPYGLCSRLLGFLGQSAFSSACHWPSTIQRRELDLPWCDAFTFALWKKAIFKRVIWFIFMSYVVPTLRLIFALVILRVSSQDASSQRDLYVYSCLFA